MTGDPKPCGKGTARAHDETCNVGPPPATRIRSRADDPGVLIARSRTWLVLALAAALAPLGAGSAAAALPYVAIDPGHGGGDTGAVGPLPAGTPTGLTPRTDDQGRTVLYEKDVNLDIAARLQAVLQAAGARTLMTRTTDLEGGDRVWSTTRADLRARVDIANEAGVDVFISVHNNALRATTTGTETFHYYYASAASRRLAVEVQREMIASLGLPDRGVKSAGFYVLRHTRMPAILTESAFLTNPSEALLLADPAVRQRIADAIGRGVQRYATRVATTPAPLAPTIGPWRTKPKRVPVGYRLVKTGRSNPVGRGGWLAVIGRFRAPRPALAATIGPWSTRPASVPDGYRLVKTGRANPTGRGGWLAVREGV
jgi:N-acetylmuramoyl-L-alanine amidase